MDHLQCRGNDCNQIADVSDWDSLKDALKYHEWVRSDAHGIYTGIYCNDCYENNYPYRKDRYPTQETHGEGDYLEDDY